MASFAPTKLSSPTFLLVLGSALLPVTHAEEARDAFQEKAAPFLQKYCVKCHGGEKVKGHVNFVAIGNMAQAYKKHTLWEHALELIGDQDMPPEDEPQPTEKDVKVLADWYQEKFVDIEARPANAKLRRLSIHEYRNSLHSMVGFDLKASVAETPETVQEDSLVIKIAPPDPPGDSGFSNDTANTPLTSVHWEKFTFLTNLAVENLFSPQHKAQLEAYSGQIDGKLTHGQVEKLVTRFIQRAFKTLDCETPISESLARLSAALEEGATLEEAAKVELKSALLSPQFLFTGHYDEAKTGKQALSGPELAERLSYFLWGTIPDDTLLELADNGELLKEEVLLTQVDRMLDDERSTVFTEILSREWFDLDEITKSKSRWPSVHALYHQPIHFVDYLFREDRPLMELIDSEVTFANTYLNRYYDRKDSAKIPRESKPKGTEVAILAHHKIGIENSTGRGGILTMPGILGMYSGRDRTSPILRGLWVLERILGDELGEPPMDVPPIPKPNPKEKLSFRQIFERHQADKSCATCHSKIDPLGFGLEDYGPTGNYRAGKKIDSAGVTPDGDKFDNFSGLKELLVTKYRGQIIHTVTEKLYLYALARKLEAFDRPTVDDISQRMLEEDGTFRSLVKAIVTSMPFTHTHIQ